MSPVRSQPYPPRRRHRSAARHLPLRGPGGDAGPAVDGDDAWMSHDELLALARSIQAAAIADDLVEMSRSVQRPRRGLRHHVEVERAQAGNLASPLRAVVFGGRTGCCAWSTPSRTTPRAIASAPACGVAPSWWSR